MGSIEPHIAKLRCNGVRVQNSRIIQNRADSLSCRWTAGNDGRLNWRARREAKSQYR